MGLPCLTTGAGEQIFPSGADLRPEDLIAAAKNLPPGYSIAIVLRFDRNVADDITVTSNTAFASLDARPQANEFLQTPSLFPAFGTQRQRDPETANACDINERKCAGCGGAGGKLSEDGIGKAQVKIFLGDNEKPVTLDGLSQPPPVIPGAWGASQPDIVPSGPGPAGIAAPSPSFIFSLPISCRFDAQANKNLPLFIRQPAEFILSYVLFTVRCQERHQPNSTRPGSSSWIADKTGRADAPILKGMLSILETNHCPQSESELAATPKIDLFPSFQTQNTGLFRRSEAAPEERPFPGSPVRPLKLRFTGLQLVKPKPSDKPKQFPATSSSAKNKTKKIPPAADEKKAKPRPKTEALRERRKRKPPGPAAAENLKKKCKKPKEAKRAVRSSALLSQPKSKTEKRANPKFAASVSGQTRKKEAKSARSNVQKAIAVQKAVSIKAKHLRGLKLEKPASAKTAGAKNTLAKNTGAKTAGARNAPAMAQRAKKKGKKLPAYFMMEMLGLLPKGKRKKKGKRKTG
jgi:hypothetical protein